jgi:ABC-2 type transport system permease protein
MSVAEVAAPAARAVPTARPLRPVSTRLLRSELRLIFGRRRNQAGMAVLAAVPIIIAVAIKIADPSPQSAAEGPDFFGSITSNGIFVALAALTAELPLFLPLAVAAISSDTIAGEANLGTLRYLLTVPVQRTRMLAVKYAAVVIFAFAATLLVAMVGLVIGLALFGGGSVTLLSGTQVGLGEGVLRLLAICGYIAIGLCALGAIGMFVSALTEQPIGGTIAIVMFTVINFILDSIPQVDWLHPYLLTHWWLSFGDLLRDPVATHDIQRGVLSAVTYAVIFWPAAWARFASRDITS